MKTEVKRTGMVLTITLDADELDEIWRAYPMSMSSRDASAWDAAKSKYCHVADLVVAVLRKEKGMPGV